MRLRKRHAWGAILIVLFALPILRPQGIDAIERPTGSFVNWFAEVPILNPRLLASRADGGIDPEARRAFDRERTLLYDYLLQMRERLHQAGQLGKALGTDNLDRMPRAVTCRVLRSRDPVSFRRSLLLDRGSSDGLRLGQPVVVGRVYFGRLAVVHAHTSIVQLVTDPQTRLEVFLRTSKNKRVRGFARRRGSHEGEDRLGVDLVRVRESDGVLRPGAAVLTAAFDERVPAGLLVGRVESVADPDGDNMPTVRVRPELDADTLTEVWVLLTAPAFQPVAHAPSKRAAGSRARRSGGGGGDDGA